jgi:hypothetical protein
MPGLDLRFEELTPGKVAPAASLREALQAVFAWQLLVMVDLVVKLAGFHRFYRLMGSWPTAGSGRGEARAEVTRETCTAVDRASLYYFKRAWCLQRSAAAVCFLRLRGIDAELVIGVRKIPFYAHAWAEVDGAVANDGAGVKASYVEITRC